MAERWTQLANVRRLQVVEEVGLVQLRGSSDAAHLAQQPVRFQHALALKKGTRWLSQNILLIQAKKMYKILVLNLYFE